MPRLGEHDSLIAADLPPRSAVQGVVEANLRTICFTYTEPVAFSEYARAPRLEMATVDLNKMVTEVSDLYRAQGAIRFERVTKRYSDDGREALAGLARRLEASPGRAVSTVSAPAGAAVSSTRTSRSAAG